MPRETLSEKHLEAKTKIGTDPEDRILDIRKLLVFSTKKSINQLSNYGR